MSLPATIPESDAFAIETAERVASVFSVVGAAFVIFTFLLDLRFRKAINRLVFYATWGNLFANVATLISREGIKRGVDAPLCQFQAFLIQWFMPADALFTFAMACNVYLTFFKQYDGASLRKLEWRYLVFCYGLPFIPAIVFLFIDTESRGKIYGSANLWCWISVKWNALRIACFYGPIWIIILFDVFIYIRVGLVVLRWRRSLLSLDLKVHTPTPGHHRASQLPPTPSKPRPTYEVSVVSQVPHGRTRSLTSLRRGPSTHSTTSHSPLSPSHARFASIESRLTTHTTTTADLSPGTNLTPSPSSTLPIINTTIHHRPSQALSSTSRAVDANRATLSYCYTAALFFLALLVTWVPSSINRVYTLVNTSGGPSPFGLDFASALVLPLQGFWNLVIYVVTSWAAVKGVVWEERWWGRRWGTGRGGARWQGGEDGKEGDGVRMGERGGAAGGGNGGRGFGGEVGASGTNGMRRTARDPYPLSPTGSVVLGWPRNDSRVDDHDRGRNRESEGRGDGYGGVNDGDERGEARRGGEGAAGSERADIVMSLDAHGRVVRQGRAAIVDWADETGEGGTRRDKRRSGGGGSLR